MRIIYYFFLVIFLGLHSHGYSQKTIISKQKSSTTSIIDGKLGVDEWQGAHSVSIQRSSNWKITIYTQYNDEYLFIAFKNLISPEGLRVIPEILITTYLTTNNYWNQNNYWFHASYSNCSSNGVYYLWDDCATNHSDWQANIFPYQNENNNVEFKISWSKLQIRPKADLKLGIAFKLSDALDKLSYWPESATISNPTTWGEMRLELY